MEHGRAKEKSIVQGQRIKAEIDRANTGKLYQRAPEIKEVVYEENKDI